MLYEFVILDHRIRKQVATKTVQSLFKIDIFSVEIDFHIFSDPNAADFRHTEVPHRIADRVTLRIEHRFFRFDDHINFHVTNASANSFRNKREAAPLRD